MVMIATNGDGHDNELNYDKKNKNIQQQTVKLDRHV